MFDYFKSSEMIFNVKNYEMNSCIYGAIIIINAIPCYRIFASVQFFVY
jgi:hypothetical protein